MNKYIAKIPRDKDQLTSTEIILNHFPLVFLINTPIWFICRIREMSREQIVLSHLLVIENK